MPRVDDVLAAETYDALYADKDYAGEARAVHELIQARAPEAVTLLDVGCGTGSHLAEWSRHYRCHGVDVDAGLLRVAARRLPDVRFHQADMRDLELSDRYDVVVSMFGTVAYAGRPEAIADTMLRLADHLSPGGLLVVQPWYSPATWPGWKLKADFVDEPDLKIARIGRVTEAEGSVRLHYEYLVASEERTDHLEREVEIALLYPEQYVELAAGRNLSLELVRTGRPEMELAVGRSPQAHSR